MARLTIRVTPRADRTAIVGVRDDGVVLIRVQAAPADGAANAAVLSLLARALRVPVSAIALVGGQSARQKRLEIAGRTEEDLQAWRLSLAQERREP